MYAADGIGRLIPIVIVPYYFGKIEVKKTVIDRIVTDLGDSGCPKGGVVPQTTINEFIGVVIISVSCWQCPETCGVVGGRTVVARQTGIGCTGEVPTYGGDHSFGDVDIISSAYVFAVGAYVVGQLSPLRIARHVPAVRTDALHAAWVRRAAG